MNYSKFSNSSNHDNYAYILILELSCLNLVKFPLGFKIHNFLISKLYFSKVFLILFILIKSLLKFDKLLLLVNSNIFLIFNDLLTHLQNF